MDQNRTDEQLLSDFVRGRRDALGELARRYESALLGLASGVLGGSESLACDAVQETWVRVIRFAGRFNGRSGFKTWVYRIAINQCRSLRLTGGRASTVLTDGAAEGSAAAGDDPVVASERADRLRAAVALLPVEKQEVLLLCYHEGLTHEEAADVLELPIGTLKSRLHGALESLRRTLSPEVSE
jgi:RNA polymerase sigma-70 factor (ECF subfamily)